jgi:CHAT domain-containing protein
MPGVLAFIPIHACSPKPSRHYKHRHPGMMDLVVSSYIPTLSALLHAQKRHDSSLYMLAVAVPEGRDGQPPLPCALSEVEVIQQKLCTPQKTVLVGQKATITAVSDALSACSWAHFACHGLQDPAEPMSSALVMEDGQLSLTRIAQSLSPKAQFAFLSACQTAKGSTYLPNESLHMVAGMQFAGFRSVVGTMWSIRDEDGFFITENFYENIRKNNIHPQASDAAHALHHAVHKLYTEKNAPAARWVPFIHVGV